MSGSCSIGSSGGLRLTNWAFLRVKGTSQLGWSTFATVCSPRSSLSTSYELGLFPLAARGLRQELSMVHLSNSCQV